MKEKTDERSKMNRANRLYIVLVKLLRNLTNTDWKKNATDEL